MVVKEDCRLHHGARVRRAILQGTIVKERQAHLGVSGCTNQERVVKFRLICFLVLIASLRKKKNNVLRLLLTLECVVLFLFIVLCFLGEIYFSVIFLRVGACEAAVGLGCLVGLIRLAGQNHISFMECGRYAHT